jgi:hypothetical protein
MALSSVCPPPNEPRRQVCVVSPAARANSDVQRVRFNAHRRSVLERVAIPVIWTANDIGVLGSAVVRRMTMCLELKIPNLVTRTRLWRRMGEPKGVVPAAPAVASAARASDWAADGGGVGL